MGEAIGTGFFVDKDGTFVTNAHVVDEAAKIWITVRIFLQGKLIACRFHLKVKRDTMQKY